jgi:dihydrodipicolinate synthase/N-acetylneuraminate lyase
MSKNCELCGFDLTGEGIKDLIPLCHTCYVEKNPQVIKYLAELRELGNANV